MKLYLDASAIVALALADDTAEAVAAVLAGASDSPTISDFGWGELVAATRRRVRARAIRRSVAVRALERSAGIFAPERRMRLVSSDIADATAMLADLELASKLPDAIHIGVARRLGATLLSTDRQQVAAARKLGVACINPLEDP